MRYDDIVIPSKLQTAASFIFLANQEKQIHVTQIKGLFADIYYGNKGCKYNQYNMLNIGDGLFGDTFAHS